MANLFKLSLMIVLFAAMMATATSGAKANPVTFSTTGVFSVSGTNVVNFTNINGTTTITFNGTTNPVNTPAAASFGDIVITTTVPANALGPAIAGNFTLNIIQVSPAGAGSLVGSLSGTIGFNTGIGAMSFSTTAITIGGFRYTIFPSSYTFALPVTGVGGGAGTGTTTITGTVNVPTATDANISGRILDTNGAAIGGAAIWLSGTQNRLTITDANGNYRFDNVATSGFYTVTPSRANYTFSPAQSSFSQLGQHTDTAFTGSLNSSTINPLDTPEFFVRQQYLDFLNREPDEPGFTSWVNGLNNCTSGDASCDRLHVSELFFRSNEFQDRGYYIYRFYSTAFGRKPDYAEFMPDMARVSGFMTVEQLEAAKAKFVDDFTARPMFVSAYGGLNNADYVDALLHRAGISGANRDQLVGALNNSTLTRAQVLRQIAESSEVFDKYYNQAFVVMEYFGYLHRDPDALYTDWMDVLNQNGDARHMIEGFVNSVEYRSRFQQ